MQHIWATSRFFTVCFVYFFKWPWATVLLVFCSWIFSWSMHCYWSLIKWWKGRFWTILKEGKQAEKVGVMLNYTRTGLRGDISYGVMNPSIQMSNFWFKSPRSGELQQWVSTAVSKRWWRLCDGAMHFCWFWFKEKYCHILTYWKAPECQMLHLSAWYPQTHCHCREILPG